MVRANRPASAFTIAQISGFYFRPCRNEYDEEVFEYFRTRVVKRQLAFANKKTD
ncbi:hypothetical protein PPTG_24035 [Phytophthora nicotianae INRA-310]|uniref:Uncharacterized protein n=1 Tax=Phytophthora nicotianae (strain INRA-310) TaxID=761204 RepID=W2PLR2_PHYN3|nr:hypothetical protein PPTG_24035 [Phytophthora nicotianae INRA-310]ETN01571.1 hypothetical protein PPTG_24035 [Phytophthora nicotianae INRA-310]